MRTLSCAVVGTTGVNFVSIDVQRGALAGTLARRLKQKCPRELQDLSAVKIQLFATVNNGKFIETTSFELSLLPEFMEVGEFRLTESILDDWRALESDKPLDSQLPSAAGAGAVVHVVALVPLKKIVYLAGHAVATVSLNESSLVGQLKEELKNRLPGIIKLVHAKDDNYRLKREDVTGRRSPQVARMLRSLIASNDIDSSLSIKTAFRDATSRSEIHVVVVFCEDCAGTYPTS
ncbi:hypothetical protein PHYPSEUDO_007155 [Phytophthora pseudosyringae]|uniref:Crinkler (CRN) family protein n=1 Tax=Phytophthora pseudosyringae TaxID=221518 RepID=A0A8T1VK61_9STRA|nr:hypothetical protein PHYPSEUDO_007155 [Phytophthora pseudosyringae]